MKINLQLDCCINIFIHEKISVKRKYACVNFMCHRKVKFQVVMEKEEYFSVAKEGQFPIFIISKSPIKYI